MAYRNVSENRTDIQHNSVCRSTHQFTEITSLTANFSDILSKYQNNTFERNSKKQT